MKIKGQYVVRNIAGETVVVPVSGGNLDSNVLIMLNETGAFLWNLLYSGSDEDKIVSAFCEEYNVDEETVKNDLYEFISYLESKGIVIEN